MACLRTVDANVLGAVNQNIGNLGFFGTFVFVPVVDGMFITQRPIEALKQRKVNGVSDNAFIRTLLFVNPRPGHPPYSDQHL